MSEAEERRWEYEAVQPGGPASVPMTYEITPESISAYAGRVRNPNPAYHTPSDGMPAMPTMILSAARMRRNAVAQANGFTALEWVKENPRQTPFAKCTMRWFRPIRAGDTLTSTSRVMDKYERRGNKFVTFRVEAANQHGEKVAEYDYTCIFEYAKGQKAPERSDSPAS